MAALTQDEFLSDFSAWGLLVNMVGAPVLTATDEELEAGRKRRRAVSDWECQADYDSLVALFGEPDHFDSEKLGGRVFTWRTEQWRIHLHPGNLVQVKAPRRLSRPEAWVLFKSL